MMVKSMTSMSTGDDKLASRSDTATCLGVFDPPLARLPASNTTGFITNGIIAFGSLRALLLPTYPSGLLVLVARLAVARSPADASLYTVSAV